MLAFNSKHPHVPQDRWIASLSDGTTVFQDIMPGVPSSWSRLRDYIKINKLCITNLRLEANHTTVGTVPFRDADGNPQIKGYWYACKITSVIGYDIGFTWQGVGYVSFDDTIYITWVRNDGEVTSEVRKSSPNDIGIIINEI